MKILTKITLLVSLLATGLGTTFATTTDALQISAGGSIVQIGDNGTCVNIVGTACLGISNDVNLSAGTDSINGAIDGWTLNVVSGTSHSPGLVPYGLDISSVTAACSSTVCDQLDIQYSDINFNPAYPSFNTFYSGTLSGAGSSTSESAYFSNSNNLFAETTLIGTVGAFTDPGGSGLASGGVGSVASYSLTLDQVFNGSNGSSFSVDGDLTGVPEPAAVVLFGTVLVFCATMLRRRRAQ